MGDVPPVPTPWNTSKQTSVNGEAAHLKNRRREDCIRGREPDVHSPGCSLSESDCGPLETFATFELFREAVLNRGLPHSARVVSRPRAANCLQLPGTPHPDAVIAAAPAQLLLRLAGLC